MKKNNYTVMDKKTTYISGDAVIEEGVIIYPNNTILGSSKIGKGTILQPNNIIEDSQIGGDCTITASVIRGANIGSGVNVGPFAYLRQGAVIEDGSEIGCFVEIKDSVIGTGTSVPHLTYIGDATVGERCDIGCGVIFANYDGKNKYKSNIGDRCFIGGNSNVIAPVDIGENSYIAAATTVTENVPPSSFIIGRVKQQANDKLRLKFINKE